MQKTTIYKEDLVEIFTPLLSNNKKEIFDSFKPLLDNNKKEIFNDLKPLLDNVKREIFIGVEPLINNLKKEILDTVPVLINKALLPIKEDIFDIKNNALRLEAKIDTKFDALSEEMLRIGAVQVQHGKETEMIKEDLSHKIEFDDLPKVKNILFA